MASIDKRTLSTGDIAHRVRWYQDSMSADMKFSPVAAS